MGMFSVRPAAVQAAGQAVESAVAALRSADCGGTVSGIAGALPGSSSANAAEDFARNWSKSFGGWCNEADQFGHGLVESAGNYHGGDHKSAISMHAAIKAAGG